MSSLETIFERIGRWASDRPAAIALWSRGRSCSYAQLASKIGDNVRRYSIFPNGSLVILQPGDGFDDIPTFLGLIGAGVRPMIADPGWPEHLLKLVAQQYNVAGFVNANNVFQTTSARRAEAEVLEEDRQFVRFSSGSTGQPKAIVFTVRTLTNAASAWSEAANYSSAERVFCASPLSNGLAFNASVWSCLYAGGALSMYHGPLARSAISVWINDFRPSVISGFPAFFDVITRGEGLNADQGQIRLALTAGAPLPPEVTETWRARTGTYIGDYYGLAETGPVTFNEGHSGDQGIPLPSASIKILDLDQREVGDGTLGRIAVRSTSMAVGTLTGASDSVVPLELCEGYFRTRDQGRLQDGRLRLLGRLDSVVTIGSEKISLSEIESIILRMEHVRGAAVRLEGGNRAPFLAAYVETDVQNPDTIRRFCETRLPWAKVPARIMTIQQLPRSAAGKVLFGAIE